MNRLSTIIHNELNNERVNNEYSARIYGGKRCAICDKLFEMGIIDSITEFWNYDERESGKVFNRESIAGHERGVFLCDRHYRYLLEFLNSYSTENNYLSGKPTKDGITTSFELELSHCSRHAAIEFVVNHDTLLTSDSTVEVECKPPIFQSLQACTKMLGKIEALKATGDIEIDNTCGTHIHTGTIEGDIDFSWLFGAPQHVKNYIAFFEPLALHVSRDYSDNERIEKFGRDFGIWSKRVYFGDNYCKVDNTTYEQGYRGMNNCHIAAFNVQHEYSIEFRLPKYVTGTQYRKIICAMQAVVIELKAAYYSCNENNISTADLRESGKKAKEAFAKCINQ